ncbi:hypothetical protein LR48_Vigan715s000400 [Vigna angularis]|uniref:chalcone synthase n=1 Tax=Phaseolus angularis TaxID=3914 RepID=A0A0L9THA1_PHAAN|nr:hypothetical protein LR48_Vigan715s000400 [Vigna angularis]
MKASHRLSEMFRDARNAGEHPYWLGDQIWNSLLAHWNTVEFRNKCAKAQRNRASEKGGTLHTGGSIIIHEHVIRMAQALGRTVHVDEVFAQTHVRKDTNQLVDERSRKTHRYMMYQQGCFAGGTVLRLAKDLAENNKGARVLVVCSEITAVTFRGPSDTHLDSLVGQALFGDGAAAVIVGSDPIPQIEKPLFELVWTAQTIAPDSDGAIDGHLREVGLTFHLLKDVPGIVSKNIGKNCATKCLKSCSNKKPSSGCCHLV